MQRHGDGTAGQTGGHSDGRLPQSPRVATSGTATRDVTSCGVPPVATGGLCWLRACPSTLPVGALVLVVAVMSGQMLAAQDQLPETVAVVVQQTCRGC